MTDTNLAQRPAQRSGLTLSMVVEMTGYAPTDIALVAKTVANGATLQELAVFLHACRALKLDPLLRQAYWIRRLDRKSGEMKGTLQVGIDGFRAIAEGSGVYAGAEPPEYRGYKEWVYRGRKVTVPEEARVLVWKIVQGHKGAFTGVAHWDEFVPSEAEAMMWAKMPRLMLAKVAEAQALRRAFPALLASLDMDDRTIDMTGDGAELEIVNPPEPEPQRLESPARPKSDAAAYDRIFGSDEPPKAEAPEPEPEPEARPEPTPDEVERTLLWQRNRELVAEAGRLKLRPPVIGEPSGNAQIRDANADLERRIRDAVTDQDPA